MDLNVEDLTLRQIKEITALSRQDGSNELAPNGSLRIAVLQRGNVLVGEYHQSGMIGLLKKASVVRRWGTSEGLGELANKGPLEGTVLDTCPDVSFHIREVIFLMEVNRDAWGKRFN